MLVGHSLFSGALLAYKLLAASIKAVSHRFIVAPQWNFLKSCDVILNLAGFFNHSALGALQ